MLRSSRFLILSRALCRYSADLRGRILQLAGTAPDCFRYARLDQHVFSAPFARITARFVPSQSFSSCKSPGSERDSHRVAQENCGAAVTAVLPYVMQTHEQRTTIHPLRSGSRCRIQAAPPQVFKPISRFPATLFRYYVMRQPMRSSYAYVNFVARGIRESALWFRTQLPMNFPQ